MSPRRKAAACSPVIAARAGIRVWGGSDSPGLVILATTKKLVAAMERPAATIAEPPCIPACPNSSTSPKCGHGDGV
eukprot:scaffold9430_cov128-Isochrysis_galbana.AAC.3